MKASTQHARQDQMVVWVFIGMLHIGVEESYKFVFLHAKCQRAYIRFFTHKTTEFFCNFFHGYMSFRKSCGEKNLAFTS